MATAPKPRLTEAEYLAIDRQSEGRHEFYRGEMFAMSGASRTHNIIAGNLFASLRSQLRQAGCDVFISDMRVKAERTGLLTFPDVVIVCENPRYLDNQVDTLVNPRVIIEILSPSTELYDRGKKFQHYQTIESLQEYVLVSQDAWRVEHYRRQHENWLLSTYKDADSVLMLESVPARVTLGEIYESLTLAPDAGS